jgi:hypothetical protein
LGELLEDAAKVDETILHIKDRELVGMLWERIGNADIAETCPPIGGEFFYLVGLRKPDKGPPKILLWVTAPRGAMLVLLLSVICRVLGRVARKGM